MTRTANHLLTAETYISSTQKISVLGKAEAELLPAFAQGSKTSEYLAKGWRETIEKWVKNKYFAWK